MSFSRQLASGLSWITWAPLRLRGPGGGIVMDGTQVAAEPRLHLVGYGPTASTIGTNRAGNRDAGRGVLAYLEQRDS